MMVRLSDLYKSISQIQIKIPDAKIIQDGLQEQQRNPITTVDKIFSPLLLVEEFNLTKQQKDRKELLAYLQQRDMKHELEKEDLAESIGKLKRTNLLRNDQAVNYQQLVDMIKTTEPEISYRRKDVFLLYSKKPMRSKEGVENNKILSNFSKPRKVLGEEIVVSVDHHDKNPVVILAPHDKKYRSNKKKDSKENDNYDLSGLSREIVKKDNFFDLDMQSKSRIKREKNMEHLEMNMSDDSFKIKV